MEPERVGDDEREVEKPLPERSRVSRSSSGIGRMGATVMWRERERECVCVWVWLSAYQCDAEVDVYVDVDADGERK